MVIYSLYYLKDFNLIKLLLEILLEIKSNFLSRKIKSSHKMGALKVEINLLN